MLFKQYIECQLMCKIVIFIFMISFQLYSILILNYQICNGFQLIIMFVTGIKSFNLDGIHRINWHYFFVVINENCVCLTHSCERYLFQEHVVNLHAIFSWKNMSNVFPFWVNYIFNNSFRILSCTSCLYLNIKFCI